MTPHTLMATIARIWAAAESNLDSAERASFEPAGATHDADYRPHDGRHQRHGQAQQQCRGQRRGPESTDPPENLLVREQPAQHSIPMIDEQVEDAIAVGVLVLDGTNHITVEIKDRCTGQGEQDRRMRGDNELRAAGRRLVQAGRRCKSAGVGSASGERPAIAS